MNLGQLTRQEHKTANQAEWHDPPTFNTDSHGLSYEPILVHEGPDSLEGV
mgnify:CR=1 FL=1